MNEQGSFIAAIIDASPRALASGVALRHRERNARLADAAAAVGFPDLVDDTEMRLRHLAESIAVDRVGLFEDHLRWVKSALAARDVPADYLLENLECVAQELDQSLPAEAGEHVRSFLTGVPDRLAAASTQVPSHLDGEGPDVDLARRYLLAVLEGRSDDASSMVLAAVRAGTFDVAGACSRILAPVQRELGRMWQLGEVQVGEEHLGSRVFENVLAVLSEHAEERPSNGRRVLLASVGGNLHDLGLRIVARHLYAAGWETVFLGADVPARDVVRSALDFEVDLVALSAQLTLHVRPCASAIRGLGTLDRRPPVIVGGHPFAIVDDLWQVVGADARAVDAEAAVAAAAQWLDA